MKPTYIIKNKNHKYDIFRLKLLIFLGLIFICVLNVYMLKKNNFVYYHQLLTPLLLCMVLGIVLNFIGNIIPFLNEFGLGFLLCALVPSYLVYMKVIQPELVQKFHKDFFNQGINFPKFFIILVMTGSIFSIDNKLLKKSMKKFIPLTLIAVVVAFLSVGGIGYLIKYSVPKNFISRGPFLDSIFYVFVPLTNGGVNFGINGLANGLYQRVNSSVNNYELRSYLVAPLILTRILTVIFASLLCTCFTKTQLNGQGKLEYIKNKNDSTNQHQKIFEIQDIRIGLLLAIAFYISGHILRFLLIDYIQLEALVYMVILLFIFKIFKLIPLSFHGNLIKTGQFMTTNFAAPMLAGFSLTTHWKVLLASLIAYRAIVLVLTSLLVVTFVSLLLAKKFGFYALEAALTAGLGSHSIDDSAEVGGVIAISKKSDLLPLINITTRIIGPIIFVISSLSFGYFYK